MTSLQYFCEVNATPETAKFPNWSEQYFILLNYNFRKDLFYVGKCVCSQLCLLLYIGRHVQLVLTKNETTVGSRQKI